MIRYLSIFLLGVFLSTFLISILKKMSARYKFLISKETPLVGGLGMGLCFILISLCGFAIFHSLSREVAGVIICSAVMLIFGIVDDYRELSVRAKFLAQLIAAGLLVSFGVRTQIVYAGNLLNIIITLIWIIGITNAFNHLDIMDGLASGSAFVISCAFFVISILNNDGRTAVLSLALIGPVFSLFLYNFPPAKVYMGNSGSHFLGFVLASIALMISYAPLERQISLLSPILILGFPILDTAFLIWMRVRKKSLPFKKSNDHLALRLLALNFSKKKTLWLMLSLCLFFCLCGILVSQISSYWGAVAIIVLAALAILIISLKMNKIAVHD